MILEYIAQIIKDYMDLDDDQIYFYNEKTSLPTNKTFTITVGFLSLRTIGIATNQTVTDGTMNEIVSANMGGQVFVDIFGRSFDVITRKEEIVQAMNSTAAKEMQIQYGFMIGPTPTTFNDISGIDGTAIPYRFQITFGVQFLSKKTKAINYYDTFSLEEYYDPTT